jgi:hypothetical protein
MTTKIPVELSSTPGIVDGSNATAITIDSSENSTFAGNIIKGNLTISGTEIDLSSGDLTIDVAGDIILDADGADIRLKDAGTEWGRLVNNSSNFLFLAPVADKDIVFNGVDGSSEITALTLDMSDAGAATFNNTITATQSVFTGVVPITCTYNGNSDTYTQTAIYANQNNTSANLNNGLTVEMGRLSNASDAEVRNFSFAARGGQISASINAEGLAFGSDTATANRLDDYEEGTWTPALVNGGSASTDGWYTKIGNVVIATYYIGFSSLGSGAVKISGLPFTAAYSSNGTVGSVMARFYVGDNIASYLPPGTTLEFYNTQSSTWDIILNSDFNNNSAQIHGTHIYKTAT